MQALAVATGPSVVFSLTSSPLPEEAPPPGFDAHGDLPGPPPSAYDGPPLPSGPAPPAGALLNGTVLKDFKKADRDKSDALDADETKRLMKKMGFPAGDDFDTVFAKFDADGNGAITQDEFEALHKYIQARATFVKFDKDKSGALDRGEATKLLKKVCVWKDDIDSIVAMFDHDQDGMINLDEFMEMYERVTNVET